MKRILFYAMLALALITAFMTIRVAVCRADQVTLQVDPSDGAVDGYRFFMRRQGQSYDYDRPAKTRTGGICTIAGLEPGVTYYFVARAFKGDDESGDSNEVKYLAVDRRPAKPTGIGLSNQ
jgi:hypothetical protein